MENVYKVNDTKELLERTTNFTYCMTLQEFVNFDKYVRCFTFGKSTLCRCTTTERAEVLVEHEYLSPALGARV